MQLYFIRHGQSENNALWDRAGPREERNPDPELTELGHEQARRLARFLAGYLSSDLPSAGKRLQDAETRLISPSRSTAQSVNAFDLTHIYCSPMIRAIHTGTYIAQALELPLILWEDVHELGGIFQEDQETGQEIGLPGNDRSYLKGRYPGLVLPDGWGNGGWWSRPFERREQRIHRAQRFFRELKRRHGESDDRVAVVSHAGFGNYMLVVALDWPNRGQNGFVLNNASITRIDFKEHMRVVYTNRVDFLPQVLIS
jgi:2,3-bisphosphoglycerate-dependent phosphoglycerate mutase